MQQENAILYNPIDECNEELVINVEKIWRTLWNRRNLLIKVFCSVLIFFILLIFITPKKYKVTADLYINKANNSNLVEFNPFILDEAGAPMINMGTDKAINNEIELMKSELVLDKVIRDNNIVYKKKFGIIPNKKEGEFLTAEAFYKKGKILKIESSKNTNVVSIEYVAKKPELAYGVVSSLITNYINLHKELNTEKSKADTKLLESEYTIAKESLNKKINQSNGLPVQSISGIGNLTAMSAFSRSASSAIGNIKGQYVAEEKAQIAINEEKQKVAQLATKLEWAKMVEYMSDSSKVLVIKEPKQLRPFEYSSPKLLTNIILGIVFGCFASLVALIYAELKSDKLTYSILTNNIIFDGIKNFNKVKTTIRSYNPQKVLIISLVQLPSEIITALQGIPNVAIVYYNNNDDYIDSLTFADKTVLISKLDVTDADTYKTIKNVIKTQQKEIIVDVLI